MIRFGIVAEKAYGVPAVSMHALARRFGPNHSLALELWKSGVHDARILASLLDDPTLVSEQQMDRWAADFDNWAVCDSCCFHLFDRTPFVFKKAVAWSGRTEEFVRRAGFALMASMAVHDKQATDATFLRFIPFIRKASRDERNFVRKAVNWALRQIGKRNLPLNRKAVRLALELSKINSPSARWIAADALRELRSPAVLERLRRKAKTLV